MSKRDTSTQKTGNTTKNQASVFKPLIASSLALALGVNIANATIELTLLSVPSDTVSQWKFTWNGIASTTVGGGVTNTYQPFLDGSAIQTLIQTSQSVMGGMVEVAVGLSKWEMEQEHLK